METREDRILRCTVDGGHILVDLDGTLAMFDPDHEYNPTKIGAPIPAMVERVKRWLAAGVEVRVFTARASEYLLAKIFNQEDPQVLRRAEQTMSAITAWCEQHIGKALPITCVKDYNCIFIFDDRAVQVEQNTGRIIEEVA